MQTSLFLRALSTGVFMTCSSGASVAFSFHPWKFSEDSPFSFLLGQIMKISLPIFIFFAFICFTEVEDLSTKTILNLTAGLTIGFGIGSWINHKLCLFLEERYQSTFYIYLTNAAQVMPSVAFPFIHKHLNP